MVVVAFTGKNKYFGEYLKALKEIALANPGYVQEALAEKKQLVGYGKR